MRLILDTNVFISGIFWEGNFCSQLIDKWKNKEVKLVSSLEIVGELIETLKIEEWKNLILNNSIITQPSTKIDIIKEDPEDNKFLEAAVDGKADLIVSQDKHLLNLKEYQGIKILNPEEAINFL